MADGVLGRDPPAPGVDRARRVLGDPLQPARAADLRGDQRDGGGDGDARGYEQHPRPPRAVHEPSRRRRAVEVCVLTQDGIVEASQVGAGLEPDFVKQRLAGVLERLQGFGLSAAAVKGEHALRVQRLVQGMLAEQLVDLVECVAGAPLGQDGLDRGHARLEPEILEAPDLGRGERLVREIVERRPAPQRERLPDPWAAFAIPQKALEQQRIDTIRVETQLVAAPTGDDLRVSVDELLTQLGDHHLYELGRRRRRPFAPEAVDQAIDRDRRIGPQRQHREQCPRLRPTQRDVSTLVGGLN